MPLYEYQCRNCGERVEALQRMSDDPLKECKTCGGELKRLMSAPAVQFKGSGWYVTDYAGKKGSESKAGAGDSSSSSGDSGSSSSGSSASDSSSSGSSSGGSSDVKSA